MNVLITVNNKEHQRTHGAAMKSGLEVHGINVSFAPFDEPSDDADFIVCWGVKQPRVWEWRKRTGRNVLVMEAGHLGGRARTRLDFVSLGWNGLAGRGTYPKIDDGGARWRSMWEHLMQPWRGGGDGYALLIGQVPGDAALYGINFEAWEREMCAALLWRGWNVVYRPHPIMLRHGIAKAPPGARFSRGSLAEDLAGAAIVVIYNSTTCVESTLAGVPALTLDEGAMAWPVTVHRLGDVVFPWPEPDRLAWAHELAWTSWRLGEIRDGTAWEALETCLFSART